MFNFDEIWGYPTDTSFGLGVRADDAEGLERLAELKGGRGEKYFSLMCADEAQLREFAKVPEDFNANNLSRFFFASPRTVIFKPTDKLPKSKFWPSDKVAFRISTVSDVAKNIKFPITATSSNLTGEEPIFEVEELKKIFGDKIKIYDKFPKLPKKDPSEIWDFTQHPPKQIR